MVRFASSGGGNPRGQKIHAAIPPTNASRIMARIPGDFRMDRFTLKNIRSAGGSCSIAPADQSLNLTCRWQILSAPTEENRRTISTFAGVYRSGQTGQTVNLMALPSLVRIQPRPVHS